MKIRIEHCIVKNFMYTGQRFNHEEAFSNNVEISINLKQNHKTCVRMSLASSRPNASNKKIF